MLRCAPRDATSVGSPDESTPLVRRGMRLEEFKFIYWMEYAHRMWGRALGLVFALPALYFVARGWVDAPLGRRLGLLFAMGATQGFVGWWMVRSGLQVRACALQGSAAPDPDAPSLLSALSAAASGRCLNKRGLL